MNIKELIEKYKSYEGKWNAKRAELARQIFLEDLKQLDEPRKVKVKQFVADWIEVCKEHLTSSLYLAMTPSFLKSNNQGIELTLWIKKNEETFARAWLDGYTVEKEKRYLVKMKGIEKEKCYLNYNFGGVWLFYNQENFYGYRAHHTRKELEEANFGWVFDCKGVEVKEVE